MCNCLQWSSFKYAHYLIFVINKFDYDSYINLLGIPRSVKVYNKLICKRVIHLF